MKHTLIYLSALALVAVAGCTAQQLTSASTAVKTGQLFCAKATANGPLVVALANAAGVGVVVTNQASKDVATACALIAAIPVTPPANPAAAPLVASATTLPTA